tara:strand:+ start:779 stop:1117 length:339 start_codon:yes stop_codon:yes gene_type:complete
MIWPPIKAWTSKVSIDGQAHFVAINYGGKLLKRWVVLMSVIDSSVVVKVSWSQLVDASIWECGWNEINYSNPSRLGYKKDDMKNTNCIDLSTDSGLTIPMAKNTIRPWFENS